MGKADEPENRYGGWIAVAIALLVAFLLRDKVPVKDMLVILAGVSLIVWAHDKFFTRTKNDRLARFSLPAGEYPMEVSATLHIRGDVSEVRPALRNAVDELPNAAPKRTVLHGNSLQTRTSTSWASWGEVIDAVADSVDGQTELRIKSRPALSITNDDQGINFQNVALIVRSLRARFDVNVLESNVPFDS